jgi:hypothetical protein
VERADCSEKTEQWCYECGSDIEKIQQHAFRGVRISHDSNEDSRLLLLPNLIIVYFVDVSLELLSDLTKQNLLIPLLQVGKN